MKQELKIFLDQKSAQYNSQDFIALDPVSIPHQFSKKQDIEIAGFFAATFSWGKRISILNSCNRLIKLMDNDPYNFIIDHTENDLKRLLDFRHRTFNPTDLLYFIHFFKNYYSEHSSLEYAFSQFLNREDENVTPALKGFHQLFFSLKDFPQRTIKHVSTPERNSACKRINMFLRWMVRKDNCGVDFGIWKNIKPSQLICPCDVHVLRVARKLKLIRNKQNNWKTAVELTSNLKKLDPVDPVKYDFALFGLGILEHF
ncbi:MAG: TIGR02757 family protein [Chitinophagales bacterium]|nr:TIGR02757 family protein [Chitinophagales bacterium]